jgi:acetyl-CoA carboxylase biotin carboxyl carrier protein
MSAAKEARLHAATKLATVTATPEPGDLGESRWRVTSPAPGWFRPAIGNGELLAAAAPNASVCIGELEVLGQQFRLLLPRGSAAAGVVALGERFTDRARVAVAFGEALLSLDGSAALTERFADRARGIATAKAAARGLVVCAPSSGRFYGRPGPHKPPFLSPGEVIERGHTVCLLEVMKTFHRVTYDDATLPERARVVAVLVAEEADVVAGQPLVSVEQA